MRGLFPFRFRGPSRIMIAGSFITTTGATTAPTDVRGVGFTVTKTEAGVYVVTLQEAVNAIDSVVGSISVKTAASALIAVFDEDLMDTDSFVYRIEDDADTLTDDVGSRASFQAVCRIGNHNA